jgi:hypothetical protein
VASGGNSSSSQLQCIARCLQGSSDDKKAMGGGGSSSSTSSMPSIAKESPETRAQLRARVAALRVEITTASATIYGGKSTDSQLPKTPIHFILKQILTHEESD